VRTGPGAWLGRGRRAGFLLLLLALCAALGLLIALPLWLFATGEPRLYTITSVAVLVGGLLFLAVRAIVRRRSAARDASRRGRSFAGALLSTLAAVVGVAGAYLAAALVVRRLWIIAAASIAVAGLVVWGLVGIRGALRKARKAAQLPAENRGR